MKEADNLIDTIRKNIIDTLVILSSREEQSKYPVPVEWFCFWLDDYYHHHPTDHTFQLAFTESELEVLSEFNEYFESATRQIGDPPARPNELWVVPAWQRVVQKAKETLVKLKDAQSSQQTSGADGV
jgi:hypothetical protein